MNNNNNESDFVLVPDDHKGLDWRIENPEHKKYCLYNGNIYKTVVDFKGPNSPFIWSIGEIVPIEFNIKNNV